VLGFVEAKKGNTAAAVAHLDRSLELGPEFRMRSYGPSMLLARELCEKREWQHVAEYLKKCEILVE
jgi:hypothetical protein